MIHLTFETPALYREFRRLAGLRDLGVHTAAGWSFDSVKLSPLMDLVAACGGRFHCSECYAARLPAERDPAFVSICRECVRRGVTDTSGT